MEMHRCLCLLLVLVTGFVSISQAYDFYVGGRDGWVLQPSESYNHWSERNRFQVNDSLVFKYKEGTDSVLLVDKEDFNKCNTDNPIKKMESGESVFKFEKSGPFFFISGNKNGSCEKGQKLVIVVLAVRSGGHIPAPTPQKGTPPVLPPSHAPATAPTFPPAHTPAMTPAYAPAKTPVLAPAHTPAMTPTYSPVSHAPAMTPTYSPASHAPAMTPTYSPVSHAPAHSPAMTPKSPSPSARTPANYPATSPPAATPPISSAPNPSEDEIFPGGNVDAPAPSPSSARRVVVTPSAVLMTAVTLVLTLITFGSITNAL